MKIALSGDRRARFHCRAEQAIGRSGQKADISRHPKGVAKNNGEELDLSASPLLCAQLLRKTDLGCPQTGQVQSSGSSSNGIFPLYSYPQTEQVYLPAGFSSSI